MKLPHCPRCNGETELNGNGGYACFFCGHEFKAMKTTYGTCHFVSYGAAVAYYKAYEQDPYRAVATKLDEGSIRIGKPSLKANQTLTIIDDGLRYAITEKEQVGK